MPQIGTIHVPTWTQGTDVPTGGQNGDFHLRTTTSDVYQNIAGTWTIIANIKGATGDPGADGDDGAAGVGAATFQIIGDLEVVHFDDRPWVAPRACTLGRTFVAMGDGPTGSAAVFDIRKNGTTIYTTSGNRASVADGSTDDESGDPDVTSMAKGDKLTVEVVSVGSTTPGTTATIVQELI